MGQYSRNDRELPVPRHVYGYAQPYSGRQRIVVSKVALEHMLADVGKTSNEA